MLCFVYSILIEHKFIFKQILIIKKYKYISYYN